MQSLQAGRIRVAGYSGPQAEAERARQLGRAARREQARMDMIRAQHLRSRARTAARAAR